MKVKIFTVAHLPPELAQKWMQHLRDFDVANPDCHFEVMADTPDVSMAEALRMMRVNPGLKFEDVIKRKSEK